MSLFFLLACSLHSGEPLASATPASAVPWVDPDEYPFESHFLDVVGGRMHYVDVGSGPTVLLVHGTPMWSYLWRDLIRDLSTDHRVIAMDHIGFGLSDKPADWSYTPEAHAANIEALASALDLHDITLIVHDFGGPIGLKLALDEPERVSRLVVLNTWMWEPEPKLRRMGKLVGSPIGKYLYVARNFSPRKIVPYATKGSPPWTDTGLAPYLGPFPTPETRTGPWQLGVSLDRSSAFFADEWEHRAALEGKPMLFVWGMADPAFGDRLDRWTEAFPRAEVLRLEGVGHFIQEEAPDQLRAAVRGFLAEPVIN
jgi:pimeloyl-ACP methyl ester carboxylesterase